MSYLIRKTDTFLRNWKKNGFRTILIMIRSIALELKQYKNLNYVNQYRLDRLPAFPAYLLQISLFYWYIWNIIKQQSRILRRNTWQIIIQNNLKKTVRHWA